MKKTITMLILLCVAAFAQQKGSFTDPRDKKTYKTVKIGKQTWMAENLNYSTNGRCYGNQEGNCQKYGRLYNWSTAKSACPGGWHLPSDAEWQELVNLAGGDEIAGKKLKVVSGWDSNGNGTDAFGFSALPGGYGFSVGSFYYVGKNGYWWSATEIDDSYAYNRDMDRRYAKVRRYNYNKASFHSVRCVQD